jgi:hypothetical protein
MRNDRRRKRDVHALDKNGMVACNPRDREAAHRAAKGDIATAESDDVICRKCQDLMLKIQRDGRGNSK